MNVNGKSRYAFLMSDLLLLCRLPSRSDPEKLYKPFRRIPTEECCIADLPDSSDAGKNRFELQVNNKDTKISYVIRFRKKDRKTAWWRSLVTLKVPKGEPTPDALKAPKANNKAKKASSAPPSKENTELQDKAVEKLLTKLRKELKEETQARTIAEQQNQVMKNLVYDQKKVETQNLMDDSSMAEFESRLESLSSLVDKLTAENITLTNQVKGKKTELISLRKANGKPIDDLVNDLDDSESISEDSE